MNWQLYTNPIIQNFSNGTTLSIKGWVDVFEEQDFKFRFYISAGTSKNGQFVYQLFRINGQPLNSKIYYSIENLQNDFSKSLENDGISSLN